MASAITLFATILTMLSVYSLVEAASLLRSGTATSCMRWSSPSSAHHVHHHHRVPSPRAVSFISTPTKNVLSVREKGEMILASSTPSLFRSKRRQLRMTSSSSSTPPPSSSSESPKNVNGGVDISIEYCSACRWMLRSSWIASELLTTFANDSKLTSVTMVPQSPPLSEGGIFRICDSTELAVLWDRKMEGRFPESKEVKQLVRDCVDPDKDLGHSDNNDNKQIDDTDTIKGQKEEDCIECKEQEQESLNSKSIGQQKTETEGGNPTQQQNILDIPSEFYEQNHVSIEYSTGSSVESEENGMYRATYYANELLSLIYERNAWWKKVQQQQKDTMADFNLEPVPVAVDSVTLIPNRRENGILRVKLNDHKMLYEQQSTDAAAAATTIDGTQFRAILKQSILNGDHDSSDNDDSSDGDTGAVGMMDDDEAEEARKYFGVF